MTAAEIDDDANFDVSDEVKKLQEQSDKYKNEYLYLRAEFENYKRNAIKERSDLIKYGAERVINDILNVADNFERALATKVTPENLATYIQGVEMTNTELKAVLLKNGITEVNSHGAPFDPNVMEALSSEATTEMAPGHVFRVFKKAYKLHDKVIRPAQVVVAKKPE
ncbi:MAG: nucleotide exchange factor GrpE [Proteobacteria bacterium]|nr:MAG: nucleotide exchange factor GrpE [Pseudomonadota bacterium]